MPRLRANGNPRDTLKFIAEIAAIRAPGSDWADSRNNGAKTLPNYMRHREQSFNWAAQFSNRRTVSVRAGLG